MVGHDLCRLLWFDSSVVSLDSRDIVHSGGTSCPETALPFPVQGALSLLLSGLLHAALCSLEGYLSLVLQNFAVMDLVQGVGETAQLESMAPGGALGALPHIRGLCPFLLLADLLDLVEAPVLSDHDIVLMPL